MNRRGSLIVFSGPSGVGKGTVLHKAMEQLDKMSFSVSATTRSKRNGEVDGVDYFFISDGEFEDLIKNDQMLEFANYNGNYYGTPLAFVEKKLNEGYDVVLEIEVEGAKKIKQRCPDAVMIFVLPPSLKVLEKRLRGRQTDDDDAINGRLSIAQKEIRTAEIYDYLIVNDDLESAVEQFKAVILAERCKIKNNENLINEVLI